jgi:hypothetical protein
VKIKPKPVCDFYLRGTLTNQDNVGSRLAVVCFNAVRTRTTRRFTLIDPECSWVLAIYAQDPNSPKPQPTALIHSVHAAQHPTLSPFHHPPCLSGCCKAGDMCDYQHVGVPRTKSQLCKFWRSSPAECQKGDACPFAHSFSVEPCKVGQPPPATRLCGLGLTIEGWEGGRRDREFCDDVRMMERGERL